MIKVAVTGAAGRMGSGIIKKITEQEVEAFKEKTREMEHQAVQEAMRGIAIRAHHEEQYYGTFMIDMNELNEE